jgi:translation initiation factor IF-2
MVVAINKMDVPVKHAAWTHARAALPTRGAAQGAASDPIKRDLEALGVVPDDMGGDVMVVEISAKKNIGLDLLKEAIMFTSGAARCPSKLKHAGGELTTRAPEMIDIRAMAAGDGEAMVVESHVDRRRGPLVNSIVMKGSIEVGDVVVSGLEYGRVRSLEDDRGVWTRALPWHERASSPNAAGRAGHAMRIAGPGMPVSIAGLSDLARIGDSVLVVENEAVVRVALARHERGLRP